ASVRWSKVRQGSSQSAESRLTVYGPRRGDPGCPGRLPDSGGRLPASGFMPGASENLGSLPPANFNMELGMHLEIPRLGLSGMPIVGVPLADGTWDVLQLGDSAGLLQPSRAPGQAGNSVITAHVTDISGADGPFAQLGALAAGDNIYVHASGQVYAYQVQALKEASPSDLSIFNEGAAGEPQVLMLVTCSSPNHTTHTYDSRLVVQAVMVQPTSGR
ncbi:MAG TPA: class F sortase, partial [Anaerolineales bacterium]|nr:class F sortase [Anaerolineales bacterium]